MIKCIWENHSKKIAERVEEEKENYCKRKWQIKNHTVCDVDYNTLFKGCVLQKIWR
jgi:hypothetical protein